MGLPATSFAHDQALELAAHWLVDKFIAHEGALPGALAERVRFWLRAVQDTRSWQTPHARTHSPHRYPATAWEALVIDWLQGPGEQVRATALIAVCVRIILASLSDDDETRDHLSPLIALAHAQALEVRALFDASAGLTRGPVRAPAPREVSS